MKVFIRELAFFIEPLLSIVDNEKSFAMFLKNFGYDFSTGNPVKVFNDIKNAEPSLVDILDKLMNFDSDDGHDGTALVKELFSVIQEFTKNDGLTSFIDEPMVFFKEIIDYLTHRYLTARIPPVSAILRALGVLTTKGVLADNPEGRALNFIKIDLSWDRLGLFVRSTNKWAKQTYGWSENFDYGKAIYNIVRLLESTRFVLAYPDKMLPNQLDEFLNNYPEDEISEAVIPFIQDNFKEVRDDGIPVFYSEAGIKVLPFGDTNKPAEIGLAIAPFAKGEVQGEHQLAKKLKLNVSVPGKFNGGKYLVINPSGVKLKGGEAIDAVFELGFTYSNEDGSPVVLAGQLDSSHVKTAAILAAVGGNLNGDFFVAAGFKGLSAVVNVSEDGFLKTIFPQDGVEFEFDVNAVWSYKDGFHLQGSGGLEIRLPLHRQLGPIEILSALIAIKTEDENIPIDLGVTVKSKLGPVTTVVESIGFKVEFSFPESGGNLGPLNFELPFKPPTRVGLTIDSQGFRGGGFLEFDKPNQRYAGMLELEFKKTVSLKAIGLITTKLPAGKKGFSLLIIITSEFNPVQLGFGFTLNGVGGLLGANRIVKIDVLREGIKTNTVSSVLFPQNIIENAPQIISDLRQIFPPQSDRFIFGPMAKIAWGTPKLITIELGLVIEVPSPARIVILGVFKALLPDEKTAVIKIQVNFMGSWEGDKKLLSFNSTLFDSSLVNIKLDGDMAFLLNYGDNPNFLVTVGGFHPKYIPPPMVLPGIKRLSVNLLGGKNPRLTLDTYFAVTSNTVQFGAKVELLAKAWKFNVYGFLAFDALFQFSPFYFIVELSGAVAVRKGSRVWFSINMKLTLEGPTPWRAKGVASFKISLLFTSKRIKVRFTKKWGEDKNKTLPDIDVLYKLVDALENKNNWEAKLPSSSSLLVTIRNISDEEEIVAHPAGILTVSQKIVPLNMTIDRFGSQKPSKHFLFSIENVYAGEDVFEKVPVEEFFAPAQFEDMDSAQKLSRKSFEKMPAGVKVSSLNKNIRSSKVNTRNVDYETFIIDEDKKENECRTKLSGHNYESVDRFSALLRGNAVAKSKLSHLNNATSVLGPGKIKTKQEGFTIVYIDNLNPIQGEGDVSFGSEAAAYSKMRELIQKTPDRKGAVQVVANYEIPKTA